MFVICFVCLLLNYWLFKGNVFWTPNDSSSETAEAGAVALSFKETRELDELEKNIAAAEARLPAIEKELALAATDAGKVHEFFTEQQNVEAQLEADMTRWAELAERAENK